MKTVNLAKAIKLLQDHQQNGDGGIFSIRFIKRTTNEIRDMVCRFDVKCALKGGTLRFDPGAKNLMIVYDMCKKDYRSLNLETIVDFTINKESFRVKETDDLIKSLAPMVKVK